MKISRNSWKSYIARQEKVNKAAAAAMKTWMEENQRATASQIAAAAYEIVTKYSEASAALACTMYDQLAVAQGVALAPAEPAAVVGRKECVRAIKGTLRNLHSTVPATTARLVKQAGADTMLLNAQRDRAEFAWICVGDSCPFCVMLGSQGWRPMSSKALRYGHAPHIHANCDCEYCVRHDGRSSVEGYEPEKLLEVCNDASDGGWKDKLRAMRRDYYKANADEINEQKRIAYAARKEREQG